jgi:hypothetical protein
MLATVLRSPQATQTTIAIVETFVKLRELSHTIAKLSETEEKSVQKSLMKRGGEIITEILGGGMEVSDTETSVEINLAVMKIKHLVRQKKSEKS